MGNSAQIVVTGGAKLMRDSLVSALRAAGFEIAESVLEKNYVTSNLILVLLTKSMLPGTITTQIQTCRKACANCAALAIVEAQEYSKRADLLHEGVAICVDDSAPLEQLISAIAQLRNSQYSAENNAHTEMTLLDNQINFRLSAREREIFRLIEVGLSNKEISQELAISLSTVKTHVHNILSKLQLRRRSQALSWIGICSRNSLVRRTQRAG
jgi:RNA polymerase sigma factor (sigma-70 family)